MNKFSASYCSSQALLPAYFSHHSSTWATPLPQVLTAFCWSLKTPWFFILLLIHLFLWVLSIPLTPAHILFITSSQELLCPLWGIYCIWYYLYYSSHCCGFHVLFSFSISLIGQISKIKVWFFVPIPVYGICLGTCYILKNKQTNKNWLKIKECTHQNS